MKMQNRSLLIAMLVGILVVAFLAFVFNSESATANKQPILPTPAPTATLGDPPPISTSVPLAQPLTNKDKVLELALQYDAIVAVWNQPWSKDTLTMDPERITVREYPSRAAASEVHGYQEWFAPEVEADAGGVWSITIKGAVKVYSDPTIYAGVTYDISKRTGQLLGVTTGLPKK